MDDGDSLCIVGAGAAGAGAAYALGDDDVDVTVLEKSRGVGGRAATRRRNGCRYDHGANYVKNPDGRTGDLMAELGTEGLVNVTEDVWVFESDGELVPGDRQEDHRWSWEAGITQLSKRLFAATDAEIRKETRVSSIAREGETWTLTDTDGDDHGPFDSVLLTAPAPQTADLLAATEWDDDRLARLREATEAVDYHTVRSILLHYDFEREYPWYALLNIDREHDVGWVSREECKPGHVPDGESLFVVQMGWEWSTDHYDDSLESAAEAAAERVATLLNEPERRDPDWVDDQGWLYAQPDGGIDAEAARAASDAGLHVAGDWVAGEGRVHAAMWNGIEAADRL
jgi:predicted NAD/FAD-dependent oxidoreductase